MRNPISQARAKELRLRPTDAERLLWRRICFRQLKGLKFRRQVPVGPFIVDFLCLEANLVIEVDGGQHMKAAGYDRNRTSYLQERGFRVIRFWNGEVLQRTDEVVEEILRNLVCTYGNQSGTGVPPP